MMNKVIILILFLLLSCDGLILEGDMATRDPRTNFDYLWTEVDQKYAYFELKGIDWDEIYDIYSPRVSSRISGDSLFRVMGAMMDELKDDHVNLISDFNLSFYGVENLGPDNFDWRIIQDNYLPRDYYISGPFAHDFLLGTDERVGYIRLSSFTGSVGGNLGFALYRYRKTNGVILDLRENGGGAVSDVYSILSRFVDEKTLVMYSKIKNGPGHNDFTEPEAAYLEPNSGTRYQRKVVLLVDRGTYSSGSLTTLAARAIPNITIMGDTTGGGLGLPNGGQLPNGWNYRFSVSQVLDLNLNNEFENGVPPDIVQYFDWNDLSTDEVIERAVQEILQ